MSKIVLVLSSLGGGGAERVAINLAAVWVLNSSHEVHLITLSADSEDAYEQPVGLIRHSLELYSDSAGLLQAIKNNRIRCASIRRTLKLIDADCVLSFLPEVNVLTIIASLRMRHRLVVAERNYAPAESSPIYWKVLRQHCYRWADSVVTQTETGATWLRENTSARAITVIPNVASLPQNTDKNRVPVEHFIQSPEKFILAVGRINEQKGFDLLIKAFARITANSDGSVWRLVIAGGADDADYLSTLGSLVGDLNLTSRVVFAGRVSNLLDWYQQCEIFVLSSRFEGFPNVLLEAMATGCAVISTNCKTGPSEIIQDQINGLLVEVNSEDHLAKSMHELMDSQEERQRLGCCAKQVVSDFDEHSIMSRWNSVLRI